jgi:hypothetical protein
MEEITFRCAEVPAKVSRLLPDGNWAECTFRLKDDLITVSADMACYDLTVLKLEK